MARSNITTLLLFLILGVQLYSAQEQSGYTTLSLPKVCGQGIKLLSLSSTGVGAAFIINFEAETNFKGTSPSCDLNLAAPEQHLLAIAYLRDKENDTSCLLQLSVRNEQMHSKETDLCECQNKQNSSIPVLFPRRLVFKIRGDKWPEPQSKHRLMITSIGSGVSVCSSRSQFPCNWQKNQFENDHGFVPSLCVSSHLACDGKINCPMSAADEILALCAPGATVTTPIHGDSLFSHHVRQSAARAAVNHFAIYRRHEVNLKITTYQPFPHNNTQPTHPPIPNYSVYYWSVSGVIFVILCIALVVLVIEHFKLHHACVSRHRTTNANRPSELPLESIVSFSNEDPPGEPSPPILQENINPSAPELEIHQPPTYASLFPPYKDDT